MQAGSIATAYGRGGRHLRFITLVSALVLIDAWLWARLLLGRADGSAPLRGEIALALAAGMAAVLGIGALWQNSLTPYQGKMVTPALRHSLATHHAGHIVAAYLQDPTRVRQASLSAACAYQTGSVAPVTQTSLGAELVVALAGLTAEEVFVGESGSHSSADLARATAIGADMVGRFGMASSLVSLATNRRSRSAFVDKVLADARTRKELESLLREAKRDSMRLMLENRHVIVALRDALMRHGDISRSHALELINSAESERHADDSVLVDLRSANDRPRPLTGASEF